MQARKKRALWGSIALAIFLGCAWIVISDPLDFHRARLLSSTSEPLRQLVTDLSAREPWYYQCLWSLKTATNSPKFVLRLVPLKISNAECVSRQRAARTASDATVKLCDLGTNAYLAIPALVDYLQDRNDQTRIFAFAVLSAIHAENDPRLAKSLQSEKDLRRPLDTFFMFADGQLYGWEVYILGAKYHPNYSRFALNALRQCGPGAKPAVPKIIQLASDGHGMEVRTNAILALGGIGPAASEAIPFLKKTLRSKDEWPQIRAAAAEVLPLVAASDPETIPMLKELMYDDHELVRVKSAMALWRCKAASATEVLNVLDHALEHQLASVRTAALQGIAEMGNAALPLRDINAQRSVSPFGKHSGTTSK